MKKIKLIYRKDSEGNFHGVCKVNESSVNSFGRTLEDCIANMRIAIEAFEEISDVDFYVEDITSGFTSASTILSKYAEGSKMDKSILIAMREYAKAKCAEQRLLIEELLEGMDLKSLPEPEFH